MPDHEHNPVRSAMMHISKTQPISDVIRFLHGSTDDLSQCAEIEHSWIPSNQQDWKLQIMEDYDTVQGAHSPPISPFCSIQPCTLYRKGHISPFSPKCIMPLSSELSRLSLFQISFSQDTSIFVLKREFYILIVFLYFSGNLFFSVLKYVSVLGVTVHLCCLVTKAQKQKESLWYQCSVLQNSRFGGTHIVHESRNICVCEMRWSLAYLSRVVITLGIENLWHLLDWHVKPLH